MEKRRIRPQSKRKSEQDVSAQWVEDKIRAEVNRALAMAVAEITAPLTNRLELAEVKITAIGSLLDTIGSDIEYSGRSIREALLRLNHTTAILLATNVKEIEDIVEIAGIYVPEPSVRLTNAPWISDSADEGDEYVYAEDYPEHGRSGRRRNTSEPVPQRTQDAIIEDVLEQVDDDLDF